MRHLAGVALLIGATLTASGCVLGDLTLEPHHGNTISRLRSECFDYWAGKDVDPAWGPAGCVPRLPWR